IAYSRVGVDLSEDVSVHAYRHAFDHSVISVSPPAQIYPLTPHDALPISPSGRPSRSSPSTAARCRRACSNPSCSATSRAASRARSEEHTSELQSRENLVCRLLPEKKKRRGLWRRFSHEIALRLWKAETER